MLSLETEGSNVGQIKEASSQWELAKIMWVSCDSDQATIINKIKAMKAKDR